MSNVRVISKAVEHGYAVIHVEPFKAQIKDGRAVVIDSFFAWVANKGGYPEARGRVIKKDGNQGARKQTWWDVPVPQDMKDELVKMSAEA